MCRLSVQDKHTDFIAVSHCIFGYFLTYCFEYGKIIYVFVFFVRITGLPVISRYGGNDDRWFILISRFLGYRISVFTPSQRVIHGKLHEHKKEYTLERFPLYKL